LRRAGGMGTLPAMLRRARYLLSMTPLMLGCVDDDLRGLNDPTELTVRGSVHQIHAWKQPPGAKIEVRDANDIVVASGTTDDLGSIIFRDLSPGDGYSVITPDVPKAAPQGPLRVMSVQDSLPSPDFYKDQKLQPGFNYITTRDGTKLAAYITLPGPPEKGPYPTVINYSGYDPARPAGPIGDYQALCGDLPALCDAPADPSGFVAALVGYATVGVNMRGTGCSGGAYDYFEPLQILDGYDIIEAVAAQDWVLDHRVGMTGISYPGISQLFVATTHPPSLAAISPLSVIGNTYTTACPGGIFNDGFALEWITGVLNAAAPYGQGWEQARVDGGDTICEENQLLHGQKRNVIEEARANPYYTDELAVPVDPTAFVGEIDVPVFLAGAWEDEQTGPFFFTLLDKFKSSPLTRFTTYNGVHADSLAPHVLVEWKAFLDFHVARKVIGIDQDVRTLAPILFQNVFKASIQIPPDRFTQYATFEEAKAAYEAEPPLRAIFESGATTQPGAPEGSFELHFDAWPPPQTEALRLYFHADGSLHPAAPTEVDGASSFQLDPEAGHRIILPPGTDLMDLLPGYDWRPPSQGYAVVFESAPLDKELVMLGTGSVDLWIRSPVDDADIEVNLSEVRPDGKEMFIQSGWLRASLRELAKEATELWPEPTFRKEHESPLTKGQWTPIRVGIAGFSHAFRAASRIRVAVDTPGDSRARWQFALKEFPGDVRYDVAHSSARPSSVALPVIKDAVSGAPLPPCPSLRGQPCRDHAVYTNTPAAP
jgi:predicted acyl esterase